MYSVELQSREETAPIYDQLYLRQNGKWHAWIEKKMVLGSLQVKSTDVVLDAGCGTGNFIAELAQMTQSKVLAFDRSERSIEIARLKTKGFPHVDVFCHDITLPALREMKYDQIDDIICIQVLQHLEHPEETLRLLYSYLRPGGTLLVTAYNANCFFLSKLIGRRTPKDGQFSNGIPYHRFASRELREMLLLRGFRRVEIHGMVNFDWYRNLGDSPLIGLLAKIDVWLSQYSVSEDMGAYLIGVATK